MFTRIFDQLHHIRIVRRNHVRIVAAQVEFDGSISAVNRAVIALQIGDRLESQADHLAASWLARATTFLPNPAVLRAEAAEWISRSDELFAEAGRR